MSCLHPSRPRRSSLTSHPAFVSVLLLCNFTSKLKIERSLGQTLFGVRKRLNSYKTCVRLRRTFEGREMFPWKMTTSGTSLPPTAVEVVIFRSCFEHRRSCKGPFKGPNQSRKRESHKHACTMHRLNPLSPPSPIGPI